MVKISINNWKQAFTNGEAWISEKEEQCLWNEYQIRSGIKLLVQDCPAITADHTFQFEQQDAPVEFLYCLSGRTTVCLSDSNGKEQTMTTQSGSYTCSYLPYCCGVSKTCSGTPLKAVGLQVSMEALSSLISKEQTSLLSLMEQETSLQNSCPFFTEAAIPLSLQISAKQILECPLEGNFQKVFLEYKALELLYTQLSLLDSIAALSKGITEFEEKATRKAYTKLMEDISTPPSLPELAKSVGLSHTRLNKLFRMIYGNTVFGILRKERLECARRLLEDGRRNVSEIAYECGFSSPSHLSRAFVEQFGSQPKKYQTEHMMRQTALEHPSHLNIN
ncbi:AraC family transcriptional regulator [Halodesulfovibrio sp.]|uniref:helix-turn-helix domain-containing protein n=1 Tax=Halodesulfovibrio sp. TaxID=1912772 RepID=UPI0025BF7F1C|nr:AraC family transcriptional regulator [Halodesulfovibrio sp.]